MFPPRLTAWSAVVAMACAPVVVGMLACSKSKHAGIDASPSSSARVAELSSSASAAMPGVLPPGDVVLGASIYELRSGFVNQAGAPARLDVFRGHPTLVAMFFATCPLACPRLIANVKAIEASLSDAERADLRVLLITIDPENDTPEALRGVVRQRELDTSRWQLFTGKDDDIRDAAAVLGIKYRESDGTINHSSVITLVDREGRIVARYDGLADSRLTATPRIRTLIAASKR